MNPPICQWGIVFCGIGPYRFVLNPIRLGAKKFDKEAGGEGENSTFVIFLSSVFIGPFLIFSPVLK